VAGLRRPGGNITGFINVEPEMGGKWLEMLKEVAPRMSRVAMMFNPDTAPGGGAFFLPPFEAAARSLAVEPITHPLLCNIYAETRKLWKRSAMRVAASRPDAVHSADMQSP
jgi:putative tryptophan/tyrosine transport system substrate-binding protein